MSRGIGELEAVHGLLPDWTALPAALLTQLGDGWFLAALLGALYWLYAPRRDAVAAVAGVWFVGVGLYGGLKELFALPRPDRALADPELFPSTARTVYELTAAAGGYGFPSGHAVNATVVYLGLAAVLPAASRRARFVAAAALAATVSLTRVALGVHYLVDVVAGAGLGVALLLLAGVVRRRQAADAPTLAFGAGAVSGVFFLASGGGEEAVLLLAVSLGALAGRQLVVLDRRGHDDGGTLVCGAGALLALGALVAAVAVGPVAPGYAAAGLAGLAVALLFPVPAALDPPHVLCARAGRAVWRGLRGRQV